MPPKYALLINALTQSGDAIWFGPAEFHEWLYTNARNAAAPYYFLYPWLWDDPTIRADVLAELQAHPPMAIVFHRSQSIAGIDGWELETFAPDLTAWIGLHYRPVPEYPDLYLLRPATPNSLNNPRMQASYDRERYHCSHP